MAACPRIPQSDIHGRRGRVSRDRLGGAAASPAAHASGEPRALRPSDPWCGPGCLRTRSAQWEEQASGCHQSEETRVSFTAEKSGATVICPFQVDIPDQALEDLRRRIAAVRWPSRELVDDRSQGVQLARWGGHRRPSRSPSDTPRSRARSSGPRAAGSSRRTPASATSTRSTRRPLRRGGGGGGGGGERRG